MPASILRKRDKLMDFSLSLFLFGFLGLKAQPTTFLISNNETYSISFLNLDYFLKMH